MSPSKIQYRIAHAQTGIFMHRCFCRTPYIEYINFLKNSKNATNICLEQILYCAMFALLSI